MNTVATDPNCSSNVAALMRSDAILPDDVVPGDVSPILRSAVLVTGATGFLGRFVVRELLARPGCTVYCLVRAESTLDARVRLSASLAQAGLDSAAHAGRLVIVAGASDQPRFGLNDNDYRALADKVSCIYHCAAEVNWARGYRQLRPSNVIGTLEVIRFACTGHSKRVLYASTIAVCFATESPAVIDESSDMLDFVDRMPLPYAQSKCVSESLLRGASARGLPISVVRPALISGNSQTGVANPADLISALIQGCIAAGAAIDTDWRLDCVPVDHVARVLVRLGETPRPHWELLNLFDEHGRDWREVVLWMNLYGYPIKLMKHADWLKHTFDRLGTRYSLFGYRRFFGALPSRKGGAAPYESFLKNRQGRVLNAATRTTLDELGIPPPALDAGLLERYLEYYARVGMLPPANRAHRGTQPQQCTGDALLQRTLSGWLEANDLRLEQVRETAIASHNGIFNEVASARVGNNAGVRRYSVSVVQGQTGIPQTLQVLLKSKPSDTVMQDLLVAVASLCNPQLGMLCENFKRDLGLAGCHERELAVYELEAPGLQQHLPRIYGTDRDRRDDSGQGSWSIAMEYLDEAGSFDVAAAEWNERDMHDLIRGLARMHSAYFGRERELASFGWLGAPPAAARMRAMTALWRSLAEYSATWFDEWLEQPVLPLQKYLIASLGDWWSEILSLPRTLVHNDCNPRNFVLRRNGTVSTPLFFDWELATTDLPQRDLAELLCFTLPQNWQAQELSTWLDLHRRELQSASGVAIDAATWHRGFLLCLRHLIINRLPLYTLMHRFRPQPFLPRVIRNWQRLYLLGSEMDKKARKRVAGTMASSAVAAPLSKALSMRLEDG